MSRSKRFFIVLIVCLFAGFSFGIITKKSDGSIQIYPENPGQSIVISANGNVGIATENPTEQLTVSGFVKATGFIGGTVSASALVVNGAVSTVVTTYTSGTNSPGLADCAIVVSASAGVVVNLPSATTCSGRIYHVKRVDANLTSTVTIQANSGADSIEDATSYLLSAQWQKATFVSNGTMWYVLSE